MGIRLTTKIDKISMKKYYLNIIKDKDQRIAELEQDLEFTTKTANELIEIKHKLEQELAELKEMDNYHLRYELAGVDEIITKLKQQLEEKDKEIESILKADDIWFDSYKYSVDELKQNQKQLAIEELEKVKAFAEDYIEFKDKHQESWLYEQIDNQIKELKGEQYERK